MPHLYRVILTVSDIDRAQAFYGRLLGSDGERVSPGRHYFDCEGVVLACYDPGADGDDPGPGSPRHPNEYVYLSVDDLEGLRRRAAEAGAEGLTEIAEMPWGERLFYFRDPFGNPISFVARGTEFLGTGGG